MTKNEALAKIKELEDYIKKLETHTGFEDDEIFLLSIEEYEKYKENIPHINCCWWLRSPGHDQYNSALVYYCGSIYEYGLSVYYISEYVRPAIKVAKKFFDVRDKICIAGYTWVVVDTENGIAIAEKPIAIRTFDNNFNDYKNSEIRKWLLDWYKEKSK